MGIWVGGEDGIVAAVSVAAFAVVASVIVVVVVDAAAVDVGNTVVTTVDAAVVADDMHVDGRNGGEDAEEEEEEGDEDEKEEEGEEKEEEGEEWNDEKELSKSASIALARMNVLSSPNTGYSRVLDTPFVGNFATSTSVFLFSRSVSF